MNVLIDLGNSRLKWAIQTVEYIDFFEPIAHENLEILFQNWQNLPAPKRVLISCVAKTDIFLPMQCFFSTYWFDSKIEFIQSEFQRFGVTNGYFTPEKLGVDRWLALIAIWQKTRQSVCVVDCGTAMTLDVLNASGVHQGGLISAGLTLMKKALFQNTQALPLNQKHYDENQLARFTESAISQGTLSAICGLIERTVNDFSFSTTLVLTGGDAEYVQTALKIPSRVEKNLVLEGLAFYGNAI